MKIAIYGYDTVIGKQFLETLSDSDLNVTEFFPLSPLSAKLDAVPFRGKNHVITCVDDFDFSQADAAVFLTTKDETERLLAEAQEAGCVVVDCSGFFSGIKEQPLILSSVNPYVIDEVLKKKLAVIPSAVSTILSTALKPAHDEWGIKKLVVTAMLAVTEFGETGISTLARETSQLLNGYGADPVDFPAQLAFNVLTAIGESEENSATSFESAVKSEVSSLLDLDEQALSLSCVSVPVFYGHTVSVHVELEEKVSLSDFKKLYAEADCLVAADTISVEDADGSCQRIITPVTCADFDPAVCISRIRESGKGCFDFIAVADNTDIGTASVIKGVLSLIEDRLS